MTSRRDETRCQLAFGVALGIILSVAACGGSTTSSANASSDDGGSSQGDGATSDDGASADDAGPASRNAACTPLAQQTGTAVSSSYGRLDGTLVYVVGIGQGHACNGDDSHVHLQIEVSGNVYDVAVDIGTTKDEVGLDEQSITVPGGTWAEGWHGSDAMSYKSIGVSSSSMPLTAPNAVGSQLESLLVSTSKISIFCMGYAQGNGCHDVHYDDGSGKDGAIVVDPTSDSSPVVFFRFSSQSF